MPSLFLLLLVILVVMEAVGTAMQVSREDESSGSPSVKPLDRPPPLAGMSSGLPPIRGEWTASVDFHGTSFFSSNYGSRLSGSASTRQATSSATVESSSIRLKASLNELLSIDQLSESRRAFYFPNRAYPLMCFLLASILRVVYVELSLLRSFFCLIMPTSTCVRLETEPSMINKEGEYDMSFFVKLVPKLIRLAASFVWGLTSSEYSMKSLLRSRSSDEDELKFVNLLQKATDTCYSTLVKLKQLRFAIEAEANRISWLEDFEQLLTTLGTEMSQSMSSESSTKTPEIMCEMIKEFVTKERDTSLDVVRWAFIASHSETLHRHEHIRYTGYRLIPPSDISTAEECVSWIVEQLAAIEQELRILRAVSKKLGPGREISLSRKTAIYTEAKLDRLYMVTHGCSKLYGYAPPYITAMLLQKPVEIGEEREPVLHDADALVAGEDTMQGPSLRPATVAVEIASQSSSDDAVVVDAEEEDGGRKDSHRSDHRESVEARTTSETATTSLPRTRPRALARTIGDSFRSSGHRLLRRSSRDFFQGSGRRYYSYKIISKIKEGGFGVIYQASQWVTHSPHDTMRTVTFKVFRITPDSEGDIESFIKEYTMYVHLANIRREERDSDSHMPEPYAADHVSSFDMSGPKTLELLDLLTSMTDEHGVPIRTRVPILVLNYMDMDLQTFIKTSISDLLHPAAKDALIRDMMAALVNILHWCGRHGILHLDVKPQNFLVSATGDSTSDGRPIYRVVLIDFGISIVVKHDYHLYQAPGLTTASYRAPEMFFAQTSYERQKANALSRASYGLGRKQKYGFAADMFALGKILTLCWSSVPGVRSDTVDFRLYVMIVSAYLRMGKERPSRSLATLSKAEPDASPALGRQSSSSSSAVPAEITKVLWLIDFLVKRSGLASWVPSPSYWPEIETIDPTLYRSLLALQEAMLKTCADSGKYIDFTYEQYVKLGQIPQPQFDFYWKATEPNPQKRWDTMTALTHGLWTRDDFEASMQTQSTPAKSEGR